MKLSKKSEYACLALIDLSEHYSQGMVKIDGICKRKDIPKKNLEQIYLLLKGAGYVKSKRGASGGYKLSRPPEDISIAEIVRLMDGALAPVESVSRYFYEQTPIEKHEPLLQVFREIRDYIADKMENTSFADLT